MYTHFSDGFKGVFVCELLTVKNHPVPWHKLTENTPDDAAFTHTPGNENVAIGN